MSQYNFMNRPAFRHLTFSLATVSSLLAVLSPSIAMDPQDRIERSSKVLPIKFFNSVQRRMQAFCEEENFFSFPEKKRQFISIWNKSAINLLEEPSLDTHKAAFFQALDESPDLHFKLILIAKQSFEDEEASFEGTQFELNMATYRLLEIENELNLAQKNAENSRVLAASSLDPEIQEKEVTKWFEADSVVERLKRELQDANEVLDFAKTLARSFISQEVFKSVAEAEDKQAKRLKAEQDAKAEADRLIAEHTQWTQAEAKRLAEEVEVKRLAQVAEARRINAEIQARAPKAPDLNWNHFEDLLFEDGIIEINGIEWQCTEPSKIGAFISGARNGTIMLLKDTSYIPTSKVYLAFYTVSREVENDKGIKDMPGQLILRTAVQENK